jgi:hypothetical protein
MQMILNAECCEEITLDVNVAAKISFGQAKRITSQDHQTNDTRVAANQGERWLGFARRCLAES